MSAMLTPGPQRNKSKLLDQVRYVSRQAGKIEEADCLSRELRERYPNYAGGWVALALLILNSQFLLGQRRRR